MPMLQCLASLCATPPSGGVQFVFALYPRVSFALLTPHRGYYMPPRRMARLTNSARFARLEKFEFASILAFLSILISFPHLSAGTRLVLLQAVVIPQSGGILTLRAKSIGSVEIIIGGREISFVAGNQPK